MFQIEYVTIRNIVGDDFVKAKWKLMYELAKQYYEKNKNLRIPQTYQTEEEHSLGSWICNQRLAYKNRFIPKELRTNSLSPLSDEQVRLLESIGMEWNLKDRFVKTWFQYYEDACAFYQKYGHLRIPQSCNTKDGRSLGSWIANQRSAYKNRTVSKENRKNGFSPLTDEQVQLLETIGMEWNLKNRFEIIWGQNYEKAKEYYEKNGDLLVPAKYICEDETRLGAWIANQRLAYKNRSIPKENRKNSLTPLTDEQIKLLEEIGMVWSVHRVPELTKQKQDSTNRLEMVDKEIQSKNISVETNKWLIEQFQLQEQNKLTRNQLAMLKNTGVYSTPAYQIYFKQAFLEVFKKVIYYFRDHKTLLEPTDITRLGWTYEEWYEIFNKNELGILDEKQYEAWKRIYLFNIKQIKVLKK